MTTYQPPMPVNGMDAFMQGMQQSQAMWDSMMKNRMRPYQMQLLKAQAQEAQGKGAEATMWAQLLGGSIKDAQGASTGSPISPGIGSTPPPMPGTDNDNNTAAITGSVPAGTLPETGGITPLGNPAPNPAAPQDSDRAPTTMPPEAQQQANDDNAATAAAGNQDQLNIPAQQNIQSPTPVVQNGMNSQDAAKHFLNRIIAAKMGVQATPINQNGKVGYIDPRTGEVTYTQIGPTKEQQALITAQGKATGKSLTDLATSATANQSISNSIEGLKSLMKNPRYQRIAGTLEGSALNAQPLGLPLGSMLSKVAPNQFPKEDLALLGQANAYMGNINIAAGQLFKGPYKTLVNNLIGTMKPNANDSMPTQMGKIRGLETLLKLGQAQNARVESYEAGGMPPVAAMLRAAQDIPFDSIKKQVEMAANTNPALPSGIVKNGYEYNIIGGQWHKRKVGS